MPYNAMLKSYQTTPRPWNLAIGAIVWLLFISTLHLQLNFDSGERETVFIGYMPVITNLAAPLLDQASKSTDGVRYKALKFSSFAEMAEALRNGQIQAAFMIAPLSIVLRQQGEDVKVVYIGNRHESTFVARSDLEAKTISDLVGKTIAVPMRYSGHNLSLLKMIDEHGLTGQINVVEMNPPDMAAAMATGSLDAYYVGEPFAAQTLMRGESSLITYVEEVWPYFMCNLMVVRQSFIDNKPDVAQQLVHSAIRSGYWARENLDEAISIASSYWNQPQDVVQYAFTSPPERIRFDRYVPVESEFQEMADLMLKFDLTSSNDITGLLETEMALDVELTGIKDLNSILSH